MSDKYLLQLEIRKYPTSADLRARAHGEVVEVCHSEWLTPDVRHRGDTVSLAGGDWIEGCRDAYRVGNARAMQLHSQANDGSWYVVHVHVDGQDPVVAELIDRLVRPPVAMDVDQVE